jgi:UDP-N-acetylmuramoyl-tripeptide--D-alanyl-D-alanine ligase
MAVITNIGPSHLQYLGTLKGIYKAKRELLDFLGCGDIALLNGDDLFLDRFNSKDLRVLKFGAGKGVDFRAEDIRMENRGWSFTVRRQRYLLKSPARHDIYNALAAISAGTLFSVPPEQMREALAGYVSLDKRMARSIIRGVEFIDDTYNSNPLSVKDAIETLRDYDVRGSKILVSGDMLELGGKSAYYHRKTGALAAASGIDKFITLGEFAPYSFAAAKKAGIRDAWLCESREGAAAVLRKIAAPGDVVLVKGSRRMRMEEVIKCFTSCCTS